MRKSWFGILMVLAAVSVSGCGYNKLQSQDEGVKAAWSEVVNQYQRRADLIPNLVATVKGYAAQEERVLVEVTEARAKVGTIQVTPEILNDPEAFAKFQAAQGTLTGALRSLIAVAENYPDLKSDANFRDLQAQLEGTENRVDRGPQPLHRSRAGLQRHRAVVPDQPDGGHVRLRREAELHGRERSADLQAARGELRYADARAAGAAGRGESGEATGFELKASVKAALLTLALLLGGVASAPAQIPLPAFEGLVTDQTGTLTAQQQASLDEKLTAFQARKGAQIAVIIVASTQPEDIAQFGIRLADAWKVGRAAPDDGVIFIVAKADRTMRIEVGHGLEGALTDAHQPPDHRRHRGAIVPAGRLLQRHQRGRRPDDPRDRRRSAARARPAVEAGRGWLRAVPMLIIGGIFVANFLRGMLAAHPRRGSHRAGGRRPRLVAHVAPARSGQRRRRHFHRRAAVRIRRRRAGAGFRRRTGVPRHRTRGLRRRPIRRRRLRGRWWRQLRRRRRFGPLVVSSCAHSGTCSPRNSVRSGASPTGVLGAIEAAIAAAESRTSGEIRFAVETALEITDLQGDKPPRERACEVFSELGVWDTELRNGVLIYVLMADRDVEIVADRGAAGVHPARGVGKGLPAHGRTFPRGPIPGRLGGRRGRRGRVVRETLPRAGHRTRRAAEPTRTALDCSGTPTAGDRDAMSY